VSGVRSETLDGGALVRLTLDAGKGNVLTGAVLDELRFALLEAYSRPAARAVLLTAAGPDFSFGASVVEHRLDSVRRMLPAFHDTCRTLLAGALPVLVAVRGRCLGGGLEIALCGSRIFAHPSATFGQPEVSLSVFAPVASLLLPSRLRSSRVADLLVTGRTVPAGEAFAIGLVDQLSEEGSDPDADARSYAQTHLVRLSPTGIRFAHRASRATLVTQFTSLLPGLERAYLDELMATPDAREGIEAFLAKRPPRWAAEAVSR